MKNNDKQKLLAHFNAKFGNATKQRKGSKRWHQTLHRELRAVGIYWDATMPPPLNR